MITLESKRAYYTFHVLHSEFALVTLAHIGGVQGALLHIHMYMEYFLMEELT